MGILSSEGLICLYLAGVLGAAFLMDGQYQNSVVYWLVVFLWPVSIPFVGCLIVLVLVVDLLGDRKIWTQD